MCIVRSLCASTHTTKITKIVTCKERRCLQCLQGKISDMNQFCEWNLMTFAQILLKNTVRLIYNQQWKVQIIWQACNACISHTSIPISISVRIGPIGFPCPARNVNVISEEDSGETDSFRNAHKFFCLFFGGVVIWWFTQKKGKKLLKCWENI